ncbi:MAG: hypothetical protein K940chlam7_01325 [Chlamydiae bacterium]|nr:hypothetical protein [Chlamydiota bacterium]
MNYACLAKQAYQDPPYQIIPIRRRDMSRIKEWRNEQMDCLRQDQPLTDVDQERYWSQTIEPSFSLEEPKQILFSYLLEEACIGYGGLTHCDWGDKRAEVSFILQTDRTEDPVLYEKEMIIFLTLLKKVAFQDLKFHRLFTETFDIRPHHISILEKFGFLQEGRLKEHVMINGKYVDSLIHGFLRKYDDA